MTEAEMKELAWDLADGHLNSVAQAEAILAALLRAKEAGEREATERAAKIADSLGRVNDGEDEPDKWDQGYARAAKSVADCIRAIRQDTGRG